MWVVEEAKCTITSAVPETDGPLYSGLIVPADGGAKKRSEEHIKKGDFKGNSRAEVGSPGNKDGTSSSSTNSGIKSKQDIGGDGGKRLVSHC